MSDTIVMRTQAQISSSALSNVLSKDTTGLSLDEALESYVKAVLQHIKNTSDYTVQILNDEFGTIELQVDIGEADTSDKLKAFATKVQ